MGREKDLDDRIGLALGRSRSPQPFDRTITRAMQERRRQFLDGSGEAPPSDTAVIQARLAEARRKVDEARLSPGQGDQPDTIELRPGPTDAA